MRTWRRLSVVVLAGLAGLAAGCNGGSGGSSGGSSAGYAVSGTIWGVSTPGAMGNTSVDVSGFGSATSDASGSYALLDVPAGTWTLTPTVGVSGWKYLPASREVTVGAADVTGVDFFVAPAEATGTLNRLELASSTATLGGACVPYDTTLVNWTASTLSSLRLDAWITQNGYTWNASGAAVTGCGGATGGLPPGSCAFSYQYCASDTRLSAGPASLTVELNQGSARLQSAEVAITLQ